MLKFIVDRNVNSDRFVLGNYMTTADFNVILCCHAPGVKKKMHTPS